MEVSCRGGALLRPLLQISSEERAKQSSAPTRSPQEGNIHQNFHRTFYIDGSCSEATSIKFGTPVSGGA